MHKVLTRDLTEGESPRQMYALYRYIDRLFEPKRDRAAEIAGIDLGSMSHRAKYLLKHTLILKRVYKSALDRHPNLRDLEQVGDIEEPIFLTDPDRVRDTWTYLKRKRIRL